MSKNLELIQDLIQQANQIQYKNGQRYAIERRADMLLRKIFGDQTHYLKSLKEIKYSPLFWTTNTPDSTFEKSFNDGKKRLLNLLNVIIEDLQLDTVINEPSVPLDKPGVTLKNVFIVHGHNEEMKLAAARTIEKLKLNPIIYMSNQVTVKLLLKNLQLIRT
jgi:hypothetical protein